jgi:hypothetical protein
MWEDMHGAETGVPPETCSLFQLELWKIYGDAALDPYFNEAEWHDLDLFEDEMRNAIDEIFMVLVDFARQEH